LSTEYQKTHAIQQIGNWNQNIEPKYIISKIQASFQLSLLDPSIDFMGLGSTENVL